MKKLVFLIAFSAFPSVVLFSQLNNWCGTNAVSQKQFLSDPKLKKDFESSFANGTLKSDDSTIFIIPVVFHVLHEYGYENISDAQIYDQMEILNEDYSATNADTSDIVLAFKQIYGNAKIQFKLAILDPNGNITNGIDRIFTHLTNNANDYSKINQWDRASYLNIWVVKSVENSDIAGYTYYPNLTEGSNYCKDGIIVQHFAVGSLGTGSIFSSRTLTHEVAHWLGLMHLFGDVDSPELPENCDYDDLITDTPLCKGVTNCQNANIINTCDDLNDPNDYSEYSFDIIDNIQNFLEFSYCPKMFTKKQCVRMREVLQSPVAQRNELITLDNHIETGVLNGPPLLAFPIVDFNAPNKNPCIGTNVTFTDFSNNGPITSWLWTFQDATPSTSTSANPTVVFNTQGTKTVTLTTTNATGSSTLSIPAYVVVNNPWADYVGPYSFDLNNPSAQIDWFRVENPENNLGSFQYIPDNGKDNSACFKLNNYANLPPAEPCTDEYNYYNQLAGVWDHLITPSFDLRWTSGATLSFDYSFGTNTTDTLEMVEYVQVFRSNDCGNNWISLTGNQGKIEGIDLAATGGFVGQTTDYIPTNNSQWNTKTIPFNTSSLDAKTRFRISFKAGAKSNNLFIDNIVISGNGFSGIDDFGTSHDLIIAPNPVGAGGNLNISYTAKDEPVMFTLRNLHGQEVMSIIKNETNQVVSFNIAMNGELPAAYYFLEAKSASASTVKKVVVIGN